MARLFWLTIMAACGAALMAAVPEPADALARMNGSTCGPILVRTA